MIWNKSSIVFDINFVNKALKNAEPLKSIYMSVKDIYVMKEVKDLPRYHKIETRVDAKGNLNTEYLFAYRTGTLTVEYKDVKRNVPLECQIPYSEWINYSHFIVCNIVKKKRKKDMMLSAFKRYES